ncbi:hypothetical protein MN116_004645 [Schistosoma mekongi]|uniref:Uncharacterized protein n=1 Tax=Schistosoma mekongi TaxID=38744 RepID=A0AAE1ZCW3_SCHME|nr:hypothetical protein MN116_004645 [Schistosoma mekongi]
MKSFLHLLLVIFCCGFFTCQMVNSQYREVDYLRGNPDGYDGYYDDDGINNMQKRVQFLRLGKRLARKSAYPYVG